jgi:hypothetical protein
MDSYEHGSEPLGSIKCGVLGTRDQVLASSEVLLLHGVCEVILSFGIYWFRSLAGELLVISDISYNILTLFRQLLSYCFQNVLAYKIFPTHYS